LQLNYFVAIICDLFYRDNNFPAHGLVEISWLDGNPRSAVAAPHRYPTLCLLANTLVVAGNRNPSNKKRSKEHDVLLSLIGTLAHRHCGLYPHSKMLHLLECFFGGKKDVFLRHPRSSNRPHMQDPCAKHPAFKLSQLGCSISETRQGLPAGEGRILRHGQYLPSKYHRCERSK
jgi:hypothetical protein